MSEARDGKSTDAEHRLWCLKEALRWVREAKQGYPPEKALKEVEGWLLKGIHKGSGDYETCEVTDE